MTIIGVLRQSGWIVPTSLVAATAIYLTFVWLPDQRSIQDMQDQVESQQRFVSEAAEFQELLVASLREIDKAELTTKQWKDTVPQAQNFVTLYEKIDALARKAGLTVALFNPQPIVGHEKVCETPLAIGCFGTLTQVFDFLKTIEGLPLPIWAKSMKWKKKTTTDAKDMQCELELVVFSGER